MDEIMKIPKIETTRLGNNDGATRWRRSRACVHLLCPERRGNDAVCHSSLDSSQHTGARSKQRTQFPFENTKEDTICEYFYLLLILPIIHL